MNRKIIALAVAALVIMTLSAGCKTKKEDASNNSSFGSSSTVSSVEENQNTQNSSTPNPNDKILGYDVISDTEAVASSGSSKDSSDSSKTSSGSSSGNASSDTDTEEEFGDNVIDFSELLG